MLDVARKEDLEQLNLLFIFHRITAVMLALFSCLPMGYFVMGILFLVGSQMPGDADEAPPAILGVIFIAIALVIMAMVYTLAICIWMAGSNLKNRQRYTYCLVIAGIECFFMPFGTILGIFTLVVLTRDSVKRLFGAHTGIHPPAIS